MDCLSALKGTIGDFPGSVQEVPRGWAKRIRTARFAKKGPGTSEQENHLRLEASASHAEVAPIASFGVSGSFGGHMLFPPRALAVAAFFGFGALPT